MGKKHFSELTKEEIDGMWKVCCNAAVNYTKSIGMSGLSEGGFDNRSHNIYNALHDAIKGEHERAVACRKFRSQDDEGYRQHLDIAPRIPDVWYLQKPGDGEPFWDLYAHKQCKVIRTQPYSENPFVKREIL